MIPLSLLIYNLYWLHCVHLNTCDLFWLNFYYFNHLFLKSLPFKLIIFIWLWLSSTPSSLQDLCLFMQFIPDPFIKICWLPGRLYFDLAIIYDFILQLTEGLATIRLPAIWLKTYVFMIYFHLWLKGQWLSGRLQSDWNILWFHFWDD